MSHLFALFLVTSLANIVTPGLGVAIIVIMAAEYGWRRMFWARIFSFRSLFFWRYLLFCLSLPGRGRRSILTETASEQIMKE